jgi:hypothetical protein
MQSAHSLNNKGHQFHQDQENKQSPPNSNGNQFHHDQQIEQSPVNSNGHQFHQDQQIEQSPLSSNGHQFCIEVIVHSVDLGGIHDHCCSPRSTERTVTSKQQWSSIPIRTTERTMTSHLHSQKTQYEFYSVVRILEQ